jgi:hypothetical protein
VARRRCQAPLLDAAWGTGTLTGDLTEEGVKAAGRSPAEVVAYAREGQGKLLAALGALTEAGFDAHVRVHWGETMPARHVFATLMEHDLYHAGELNVLRSVLRGVDRWPGQ